MQINPGIPADAAQDRLLRELDGGPGWEDFELDARRHIGLVRAAHRVVVVAEDQLGAHAGIEGQGTAQRDVRSRVVGAVTGEYHRERARREREIRGERHETLHAAAEVDLARQGSALVVHQLQPDERVPAGAAQNRLLRNRDRLAGRDHGHVVLRLHAVAVRSLLIVGERETRAQTAQGERAAHRDVWSGRVVTTGRRRAGGSVDGHSIALGDLRLRDNGGENVVLLAGLLGTPGDDRRPEECEDGGRKPVHLLPPACWM